MSVFNEILSLDNPVFKSYLFYGSLLVGKMLVMSLLTGRQRIKNKAFANPEDAITKNAKVTTNDDVERVRRAHLNDLENILPFFTAGFAYLWTNPSPFIATWLFRLFTAARFTHTLVYAIVVIPQPARGLAFFVGFGITGYFAIRSIIHFA